MSSSLVSGLASKDSAGSSSISRGHGAAELDLVGAFGGVDRQAVERPERCGPVARDRPCPRATAWPRSRCLPAGRAPPPRRRRPWPSCRARAPSVRASEPTRLPFSVMPSAISPRQTRAKDSLPVWAACWVLKTRASGSPSGRCRSRSAVARRFRRLVAQRLQQPTHAVVVERRAEEHRHDQAFAQLLGHQAVNLVRRRHRILEQGLEQAVVEIGQRLQHLGARRLLAVAARRFGDLDQFEAPALLHLIGALADQVDVAVDRLAVADRDFAQDQRPVGHRLQRVQRRLHADVAVVHLVDEDDVRNVAVVEEAQQRRHRQRLVDPRLADQHRRVATLIALQRFLQQLDGAGAVEEGPGFAQILGGGDVDLDAHLARARLGCGIADGVALADAALADGGTGDGQDAFEQGRLAAEVGADECCATGCGRSLCGHDTLPGNGRLPRRRSSLQSGEPSADPMSRKEDSEDSVGSGKSKPGGTGGGCFEVLGEASAAAEPGEAALDHPPPGQELEAFDTGRALDDLDRPGAAIGNRLLQLRAAIDAVGEDMGQLGEGCRNERNSGTAPCGSWILAGCTWTASRKPSVSVTMWRLRPLMRLPASMPRGPPLSVVGTLWLSMMPTEGTRLRPARWRARATSVSIDPLPGTLVAPTVEVALHRRARRKISGRARHWQPVHSR